jgi:hypothetical protein
MLEIASTRAILLITLRAKRPSSHEPIFTPRAGLWIAIVSLVVSFAAVGCGLFPKAVPVDDPRVQTLLKAAGSFDRAAYGFSPLPTSGNVHLESRPRAGYDTMLHLEGRTTRTIAFRKNASGYCWIGEQETFRGPKTFKTPDGTFHEMIVLSFEEEHVSGVPLNELSVTYDGDDPRLADRHGLSLSDVKPILTEWGY